MQIDNVISALKSLKSYYDDLKTPHEFKNSQMYIQMGFAARDSQNLLSVEQDIKNIIEKYIIDISDRFSSKICGLPTDLTIEKIASMKPDPGLESLDAKFLYYIKMAWVNRYSIDKFAHWARMAESELLKH